MEHHAADWATTRPVVSGTQGVIAAGHPLVSMAGMRMLLAGGNAFDAAVAAGFAAAVVEPTASYTLCGECVALVYDARSGETQALSGQGTAPGLATIEAFRGRKLDRIPTGPGSDAHLSFTVPGAVDAYLTLLETHGTKTVSEVLVPAVHYAERGFPMYEYMHRLLAIPETRSQFDVYPPGGTAVFYPGGRVPEVGEVFVQPALAGTLRKLMEADAQGCDHRQAGIAAARQRFYRGDIAATIGAFSERLGGLLRASDLAGYRARLEPPLRMTFAGREIVAQAAWTQGPVLLQALGMLATLDLRALGHNSARYIHVVTEALKLAFADRERYYGDADSVPMAELLSPAYARERAALIRPDRAMPEAPAPGDPRGRGAVAAAGRVATGGRGTGVAAGGADGTTHIAAIDRDGNMVSPDAERRRVPEVGVRAGAGLHAQHAQRDVRPRGRPPQRAGAGQAPAHDAGELPDLRGRRADHHHRLPGRRRSGPGRSADRPQPARLRHEPAAGGRGAPLLHPDAGELVLSARLPARAAQRRARHPESTRAELRALGHARLGDRRLRHRGGGDPPRSGERRAVGRRRSAPADLRAGLVATLRPGSLHAK